MTEERRSKGLLGSVQALAETLITLIHTRLELAANEIQEEKLRIGRLLLLAALALLFLVLGVVMLTLLAVVVFWDSSYRLLVIAVCGLAYIAIGISLFLAARRVALMRPRLFDAMLGELKQDRDRLAR